MSPHAGYRSKILSLNDLARVSKEARLCGKRRVLCHGKFEVMHPGHTRHLDWARRQGDVLLVTTSEDSDAWSSSVPVEARLESLAALSVVDHVAMVPCLDATKSIALLEPDVLVRGVEYRAFRRQTIEREKQEIELDARFTVADREVLEKKDFAQMTAAEIAAAKDAIKRMVLGFDDVTQVLVSDERADRRDAVVHSLGKRAMAHADAGPAADVAATILATPSGTHLGGSL